MRPSLKPTSSEPPAHTRELRADARRNRQRLLVAADELFSERGADASMDDIARRAKVGIGTLYRHFPTREALLAATVEEGLQALARHGHTLAATEPPADALAHFFAKLVEHASAYRGLSASFGVVIQAGTPGCKETTETGRQLLARAQAEGDIRRNVQLDDVVSMAAAISLAVEQQPVDPDRAARLIAMLFDGLRAAPPQERPARHRAS